MRIVGVVAEYDPFHNGHARQLAEARRLSGADAAVVVMSGFFTQRGAPACLTPFDRASCALAGGADLAALLPAAWSLRSAEGFALGAVTILRGLGADALSFGAETADVSLLRQAAAAMDDPSLRPSLRRALDTGMGWAAAMEQALTEREPALGALMREPNNALAVAYLRAAARLDYHPDIFPVPRTHPHHAPGGSGTFASGSGIREALARRDWDFIASVVPETTNRCLKQAADENRLVFFPGLDQALLSRLRTLDAADFAALPDCTEGLDQALRAAGRICASREQLITRLCGRRYSRARISRLCASALLGLRQEELPALPDCAVIIGVRAGMECLLRPASPDFPLLTRSRDYPSDAPWFRAETRAADLWALAAGLPAGLWERAPLIRA